MGDLSINVQRLKKVMYYTIWRNTGKQINGAGFDEEGKKWRQQEKTCLI